MAKARKGGGKERGASKGGKKENGGGGARVKRKSGGLFSRGKHPQGWRRGADRKRRKKRE